MSTLPVAEEAGDAELISAVRGGDLSAYGVLFERHFDAARRLARQLTSHADADDLVSDAFAKVMKVLQNGGGPDLAFRAYLLTAVRRLHVDRIRATSKLHTTDDLEPFDPGVPFRDTAVEGFENAAAAKAFASLPERWQLVLWHTEVEGQKPADVAPLLGMSANSVSALAYRAREGLRQAFLNSHATELDDDQCRWTHEHLGGYVRHGLSKRDSGKVEKHLDECRGCMAIYLELTEVNSNLGALLAPLLLGTTAGVAYLSATGGLAAKGGLLLFLGRAKDTVTANTGVAAAGGMVAVTAIAGVSVAMVAGGDKEKPTTEIAAPATGDDSTTPAKPPPPPPPAPRSSKPAPAPPPAPAPEPADPAPAPSLDEPAPAPVDEPPPAPPVDDPPEQPDKPAEAPPKDQKDPPDKQPPPDNDPAKPPATDLTLSVVATPVPLLDNGRKLSASTELTVKTGGYPPGKTATLRLEWSRLTFGTLSPDCEPPGLLETSTTCTLSATNPTLSGQVFNNPSARVTFELTPNNFKDANPDNNQTSWTPRPPGRS